MTENLIARTPSAYGYPLLIKQLFEAPLVDNPDQEIVYKGTLRFTYRSFRERVRRLAGALVAQGVKAGDTVAILDWDSHRYLECFFAVPMIGAVLHTVNVRLTPEQILFTINHAEDDVILVHKDFLPILEAIKGRIDTVRRFVLLTDDDAPAGGSIGFAGEYEGAARRRPGALRLPGLRREHPGDHLLHDRHHRRAQGRLLQPPPARAAHPHGDGRARLAPHPGALPPRRRLHAADPDVPRARLGGALPGDHDGRQAGLPGALRAGPAARAHPHREGHLHPLRADDPADAAAQPRRGALRPLRHHDARSAARRCPRRSASRRCAAAWTSSPATGCRRPARS